MSMSVKDRLQGKQLNYVKREVPAAPGRLIRLDRNENNIGYSPNVKRALEACAGDLAAYPDVFAAPLRSKLAAFHGVRPEEILVGNGSFELINLICQVFLNPDDEVLFPDPTFEFYKVFGELAGGRVVRVPLEKHRVPLERLLERVTSRTRLVWICNPNNPTGTALGQEELTDFFRALPSTVLVVVDEAYLDFVREIQPPDLIARLPQFPNLVLLRTFSKAYGLAGARVGYAIANESVIGQLIPWKTPPNTNYPGTAAAAAALEDRAHYRHVVDSVAAESRRIYETLERLRDRKSVV